MFVAENFYFDVLLSFSWTFLIAVSALKIVSFVGFTCTSFNTSISYGASVHAV